MKGHAEITLGNVIGSAAYFFPFNAGLIALTAPLAVDRGTTSVYYLFALVATALVGTLAMQGRIGRVGGAGLVGLYLAFVAVVIWFGRS